MSFISKSLHYFSDFCPDVGEFPYLCSIQPINFEKTMAEKSLFDLRVEPQEVDFTMCATVPALGSAVLNAAGVDAHGRGFGVDALFRERRCSWVLSRMAFEVDRRPEQYADYRIATWISDYGRVLSTRNFTLSDASGAVFGRAVTQWAMLDLERRTAVDLSEVGRAHDDAVVPEPSPAERPRKIPAITPAERSEHRVAYSDIDFNRHMNTMRYIDLMFDALPLDLVASQRPVRLDIHFLRECRYGDLLTLGWERRGDCWLFGVVRGGEEALRASIEWR